MKSRQPLDLALIGNSNIAALLDRNGSIVWTCWPRIDGDPVFCALVDGHEPESGFFSIAFEEEATTEQSYLRNTPIVRTVHTSRSGASFAVTDFAPRFRQHERIHRPPMIVRRVEPLTGLCRIRARLRPRMDYGRLKATPVHGSNHIRYVTEAGAIRLTTDAPIAYVASESAFVLSRPVTFIVHADETFPDSIPEISREFHDQTRDYWLDWVRYLSVPYEWQEAVIRAAITLQLCSFEETGAIVAALTTSIPEAPGTERNWDYRYCWIRDAFFTVHGLNRLGATLTMERFLEYVTNVVAMERGPGIKPVYAIVPEAPIDERVAHDLRGFCGHGPVRIGNAAALQVQHDVYGSVLLAASQMFFDERLPNKGDEALYAMLEPLGVAALNHALTPDSGIWEYRGRAGVHTHSAAMCWVACDRLARIAESLGLKERADHWRETADKLRETILTRAWNPQRECFVGCLDGSEIDASVLLLHELGIVSPSDPRFISTVEAVGHHLGRNGHLFRYSAADDFGEPAVAFTICSFWYVDALAAIGRLEEARRIFEALLACRNHVGLLSEDIDPVTGELWGNFPQTYSMVGLIVAAMRLSMGWEVAR
ncbi:MAG TPA: glycoside hydrolase family 15 protein [Hyphomicrobiaceae bacterium]|nr:glycoside hydrolase family 15 protein [Hyphomicrobiaceae bacterium]